MAELCGDTFLSGGATKYPLPRVKRSATLGRDCKIYLLYGATTNTERSFLLGESPVETWTYSNNVKRVFRFEEHSHGEYKLTDVRELAARN